MRRISNPAYSHALKRRRWHRSFGLVLALLSKPKNRKFASTSTLLIVPHRDLAFQFLHWIERIVTAADLSLSLSSVAQALVRTASTPVSAQLAKMRETPPLILIGTPQTILDAWNEDNESIKLQELSTVVVDEADYLIDYVPAESSSVTKQKVELRMKRHPKPTKVLLDTIYAPRISTSNTSDEKKGRHNIVPGTDSLPQLVLCSATFRSGLRQQLYGSGWIRKGQGSVIKVSGEASEFDKALFDDASAEGEGSVLGGRNVAHCALVINADGDVKNIDGAVDAVAVEQSDSEIKHALPADDPTTQLPELPEELMISR